MQPVLQASRELDYLRGVWRGEAARLRDRLLELNSALCAAEARCGEFERDAARLNARILDLEAQRVRDVAERDELGHELDRLGVLSRSNSQSASTMADDLAVAKRRCADLESEVRRRVGVIGGDTMGQLNQDLH